MFIILVSCLATLAAARPSFIAVPADQIAFVDLSNVHVRVPRQTLSPPPLPQRPLQPQPLYEDEDDYQPIVVQQSVPIPIQQQHLQQPIHLQHQPIQLQHQPIQLQHQPIQLQQYQQQPIGLAPLPEHQHLQHQAQNVLQHQPQEAASVQSEAPSARFAERPPDFGEYVDFGAHTGDNGAFGWYADYPINNQNEQSTSSFKK